MAEPPKNPSIDETQHHGGGGAVEASEIVVKSAGGARKKDDDIDKSPLLVVNNLKNQRLIYEQMFKTMKWNFTTPHEESEFLKELMNSAGFDKTLIGNMFHVDFRYRLKAIQSLWSHLTDNIEALVSNLDLILKWLRLRFFDTNLSVIVRSLLYLQVVLYALYWKKYHMHKIEAASFIPYLITKFGDPEDDVRMGVRSVFRHISHVYPSPKLFFYLMKGMESENALQRTECLDQMGSLIDKFGTSICTLSPIAALREVAKQIADRDNSVRNAALNCIEQAYYYEGELIFKLIGQISETDLSLLKERIKKASKNRPVKSAPSASTSAPSASLATPPVQDMDLDYDENDNEEEEPKEPDEIPEERCIPIERTLFNVATQPTDVSPISPDELEATSATVDNVEQKSPLSLSIDELAKTLVSMLSPKLAPSRTDLPSLVRTPPTNGRELEETILSMASADLPIAIQSMIAIENLIKSEHVTMIQTKEDDFVDCVNKQLQLLQTLESDDVFECFQTAFSVTFCFFDSRDLGRNVSSMHLQDLVHEMLTLLAKNKLERLKQSEAYTRVINNIVVKIIDNSNHTSIICVLIELLRGCAKSRELTNYEELVLEFLWKIIEIIPNWDDDLDYRTIVLEVYLFNKVYVSSWWGNDSRYSPDSPKPLETIERLSHDIIRVKGRKIPSHMTEINNTQDSELQSCSDRLNTILNRNIPIEKTVMDPIERLQILRALEAQCPASLSNQANHT